MTTSSQRLAHEVPDEGSLLDLGPIRRAPRISRDDVFRTADELLVAGHRPTIDRVRVKLGRGSPNTINDYLDAWWAKLGSRLRDLPDRQFPQVPDRVGATLQQLWNEALEGAHEALQGSLSERDAAFTVREQELVTREEQLATQERAAAGRNSALDEALALTRAQLAESNKRATVLEESLKTRDTDLKQSKARLERLEHELGELARKLDSERARLEERHTKTESRWMSEVDRAREALKESEKGSKELKSKVRELCIQHDRAKAEVSELQAELKTSSAVRVQLEERIRLLSRAPPTRNSPGTKRSSKSRKPAASRVTRGEKS